MTLESYLRPSVRAFALAMEDELRLNDFKGGWESCDVGWLLVRAAEELAELQGAVLFGGDVLSEAADLANIVHMIADVLGVLHYERQRGA